MYTSIHTCIYTYINTNTYTYTYGNIFQSLKILVYSNIWVICSLFFAKENHFSFGVLVPRPTPNE